MPTNSNSDMLYDSDDPRNANKNWNEMTETAKKCPGISVLERWMDDSLEKLEEEFNGFATQKSMRQNFGR